MSIFSNFLKLFKYEPTIDAQNTFNIQTALNNNWDKVDNFAKDVSQQLEDKADLIDGKVPSAQLPIMDYAPALHTHTKANIIDFPVSMPANGGNADTVNNKTVESNVPVNAKFTDTVYTHPSTHPASMITGLPTSLPASDVYAWAKQPNKPSYNYSEVGAAPNSHSHSYAPPVQSGATAPTSFVGEGVLYGVHN